MLAVFFGDVQAAQGSLQGRFGVTPVFTGTWSGFVNDADAEAYGSQILWNIDPSAGRIGTFPVYAWYHDSAATPEAPTTASGTATTIPTVAGWYADARSGYAATDSATSYRNFGNIGLNYTMKQVTGAYTPSVDPPNTDILNPARKFRPDMEAYNRQSQDDIGSAIRDPKAGIEYVSGGTSLSADGADAYAGTMTVEGAGGIVNLGDKAATTTADRIDLTSASAGYTVSGAEHVPTADIAVHDVTEADAARATSMEEAAAVVADAAGSATTETLEEKRTTDDVTLFDDASDDDTSEAAITSVGTGVNLAS